ncbi:hypothetical protein [Radiobacillus deserti]|uniref:Uncharacterized protein n=1 Tax=Radiobacillus deserti TaxID=2594883 RepID=A0A516KJH3_9BACI|nr:hypothetical protein [Radiobacillus deserti]QDP41543.1 hypothetical protein FN924_16000 [Radiobacillus deserti]
MKNEFYTLIVALLTTIVLYGIGHLFHIELLDIQYKDLSKEGTGLFEAEIALVPLVIGVLVGILFHKWRKTKS